MDNALQLQPGTETRELTSPSPGRVDILLAEAYRDLSRARIQRLIEAGAVTLNGAVVRKSSRAETDDVLSNFLGSYQWLKSTNLKLFEFLK